MPIPFLILIILILIYLVFIVGPAVAGFFAIFKKPDVREPETMNYRGNYREPFEKRIRDDSSYLHSLAKKRIWLTSQKDGTRLCADCYEKGSDKTAVLIHGYSTSPYLNLSAQALWFMDMGWNVLLVFQRAHGVSEGNRSTLGLLEQYDLMEWIHYLDRAENVKSVRLYGTSMGATTIGFASDKIQSKKVKALVLDAGYTSPYKQMEYEDKKRRLPYFLLMPICGLLGKIILKLDIKSSPEDSLKNTTLPCFFLHGTADTTVPLAFGEQNFAACAAEKEKFYVEGANHLMSFLTKEEEVKSRLLSFINKYIV